MGAGPEVGWTQVGLVPPSSSSRPASWTHVGRLVVVGPTHTHTHLGLLGPCCQFLRCFPAGRATRGLFSACPARPCWAGSPIRVCAGMRPASSRFYSGHLELAASLRRPAAAAAQRRRLRCRAGTGEVVPSYKRPTRQHLGQSLP